MNEKILKKTIKTNKNVMMNLGMNGLAYSSYWNKLAKENEELEKQLKENKD